ncbi:MAG: hypothetical protein N2Z73_02920, partial [Endomicrobia bacterium]|nr:hypothetical protein [Endomicrobiia bacterium]
MLKKFFNKYSVLILIFIFLFVVLSFANIHFGIVSAVKKKVKELKEKKDSTLIVRPAPDTVILNETTLNNFSRQEGSLLYFSLDATEIGNLQQGKIIIGTKGEGFLRRVVSVTKTSTEYIVETASTTLEEAFEDLQLNMTKKLQSSDLDPTKTPRLKKGVILKESPSGKFTISISRDFELYSQDDLEISIEGSIEFDLDLNCTIEIKKGSLKKIRFTGTLTETASVGTTIEYKKELEEEITLGTLYFAPIVVGPVTFVPEVRLVMGVSMEGGIKLEAKVSQIASLTTGLEYNDGSWYPVGNFSTDFDVAPPELTASGEVKAYIGPDIALKIYGVVGPSIGIEGYFKGEAQLIPIEQRFFKIYGGIECSAGVEFTILSFFKLGYETTIIDWKKLIYEADLVYFGTPPKLLWAGEPYFKDTGVSPEVGVTTNTFVFRVKYKDDENNAPSQGYPKVHILKDGQEISGSPFTMDCVDINPYYKNGVIYEYYTRLSSGNYNYYFEAKDIMGNKAIAEAPVNSKSGPTVFKAPNKPPILTWTGEHYYGNYYYDNRGVCPYQGKPNRTPFVFRVMYQDPDGDQGYVKVHILKNGQEISGSPFLMDYFSGSYATGAIYRKIITLPSSGNDYTYYFEATDIYLEPASGEATQTKTGPNVDESFNHIPEINWYGTWNYTNDGLDPEKGKPYATPFRYRITYRDIDNDPPLSGSPKLHIKKDGVEISSSPFTMGSYNTTYTSGVGYDSLIYLSSGVYSYYFEVYDVDGATATGVNKIEKQGPTVDSKPPQLLWVGDTNYETDGLHPESGKPKDNFVYRIKYKDPDDDPPKSGYPKLHIKKDGVEISSSPFSMTKESPYDTQFATGVVYKYTIKLSTGSNYSYYFEAEDDSGFNVITEEKKFYPTVTNQAPVLEWTGEGNYVNDGLDPETGRPLENFKYRVKYKDPDGDPPESGYPKVHILKDSLEIQGSPFGWTFQSGEG